MKWNICIWMLLWFLTPAYAQDEKVIERIAFGSCARESLPQPIWEPILAGKPDLFIFGGDNIYADTSDMAVMKQKYDTLAAIPGYKKLAETTPILSIWDDHDYGKNDAGKEFHKKKEAAELFLDFFKVPKNSPRRQHEGIYGSYYYGPKGKRLQVILLDTRYFRTGLLKSGLSRRDRPKNTGRYKQNPDPAADILGPAQWSWLEAELKKPADVRLVVTSIQLIFYAHMYESWGLFPKQRQKMIDLIGKTGAKGVIFLSGDVHRAEINRIQGAYPIYDFTASGMTHAWDGVDYIPNPNRVPGALYSKLNYGTLTIHWEAERPSVVMQIHDKTGEVAVSHTVYMDELAPQ